MGDEGLLVLGRVGGPEGGRVLDDVEFGILVQNAQKSHLIQVLPTVYGSL